MARHVALKICADWLWLAAGVIVLVAWSESLEAEEPMMQATTSPAKPVVSALPPTKPVASTPSAVKGPVTNAPPLPDTLGRYGKILEPGDAMNYPLRLKMPFPGVGEVKIPTQNEWVMRDKLEQLSKLTDDQIRAELLQWPAFSHMSLRDEGTMLSRIQDFRDYHAKMAMQKAHDMGLLTMTDDQKKRFEKEYWDKKLQMDHDLSKQFEAIFKAREQKMQDELYREFSSPAPGPIVQAPKPAPAPPKPPAPSTPVVGVAQPGPGVTPASQPIAQSPAASK